MIVNDNEDRRTRLYRHPSILARNYLRLVKRRSDIRAVIGFLISAAAAEALGSHRTLRRRAFISGPSLGLTSDAEACSQHAAARVRFMPE